MKNVINSVAKPLMRQKAPKFSNYELIVGSTGWNGLPTTCMLVADNTRYLINCGEGTQRVIMQSKLKMSRIEGVFITQTNWDNMSGLGGLALSYADKDYKIPIKCLVNIEKYLRNLQSFSTEKIPFVPLNGDEMETSNFRIEFVSHGDNSVVIFCPKDGVRHLMVEKCKHMGGKWIGELLKEGEATMDDGRVVGVDDLFSTPERRASVIFVEIRSEEDLERVTEMPQIDRNWSVVVHLSPQEMISSHKYQNWLQSFGTDSCHIFVNDSIVDFPLPRTLDFHRYLTSINPEIFPPIEFLPEQGRVVDNHYYLNSSTRLNLNKMTTSKQEFKPANLNIKLVSSLVQSFNDSFVSRPDGNEYPQIVFLGTSSAQPSITRNLSAILVWTGPDTCFLLDCGPATLIQLRLLYGDQSDHVLKSLRAIFVSHMHFDHHGGVHSVVLAKSKVSSDQILMLSPTRYKSTFCLADSLFSLNISDNLRFVNNYDIFRGTACCNDLIAPLGLKSLRTVSVTHIYDSHGIVIETENFKIVYSGDTRPCPRLVDEGRNADLLIHEATFGKGFENEAEKKRHSTLQEALRVGEEMGARWTLVTHLSSRYKTMFDVGQSVGNWGIAFDFMKVDSTTVQLMPRLMHILSRLLLEDESDMF